MATAMDADQEPLISPAEENRENESAEAVAAIEPSAPPAEDAASKGATPKTQDRTRTSPLNENEDEGGEGGGGGGAGEEEEREKRNAAFECNICLDVASDAVISMCGHLFCWPCLHTWLETRPHRQICPVCKAGIGKDKVVPVYGRGDSDPKDPREKPLPPRPRGQRPEPDSSGGGAGAFFGGGGAGGAGGGGGFQMSFGIGAFPFGFFATNFVNLGDRAGQGGPPEGSAHYEEEQFLHKAFLWVAFAFIFWLLIA